MATPALYTNASSSEVNSPFVAIADFFNSGLPAEHRKDLNKWRYHVINDAQFNSRHGAVYLLSVYEETIQLIEAAHLLLASGNSMFLSNENITESQIEQERKDWEFFPHNLSEKEILNPLAVIKRFFKQITLEQYKEYLHEWLRIALSDKAVLETLTAREIIEVYDNLRKLYSATWLIYQRKCR
ncbi:hypothetical protein BDD43_0688 [Mucilaginibacter gracilis]|uniref:Uncharacterized protein n=1 Tax=Mucilaginibacter gracilis TaxID=423350 RepID=A0A495IUY1_9SPHI|nr:hypothetical protein [Mucilaginibacter gracilis]RKR80566.1 hypothetical protein BDD43_0688 [Mucilaginibacter gracilis]